MVRWGEKVTGMVDGTPTILLFSKDKVGVQPQHANESSSILICAYCSSGKKHDPTNRQVFGTKGFRIAGV